MNETTTPSPDAAIQRELDAIAGGAAAPAANDPLIPQEPPATPMDWRMAAAGLVLICDKVVAPNWQLETAEKDALSEGFTQVLSAFFPTTNLDPRVQSVLALGAVMLAITAKRTDLSTGRVMPLRAPPPEPEKDGDRQAAQAD
jgi:hypothetical protein